MPCFYPIPISETLKLLAPVPGIAPRRAVPRVKLFPGQEKTVGFIPCGNCLGCKQRRSAEWSIRVCHEMRHYPSNLFLTLTYDDAHLPVGGHLVPRDLQLFLKKLRQAAADGRANVVGSRLRYIACGEYGERTERPHYHAIVFGLGLEDRQRATSTLYKSPTLTELWGLGEVLFGEVTAASAAYVAGYTVKSLGRSYCDADGVAKPAPFFRCSTRPGIGAFYADSFAADFRSGALVFNGTAYPVPRYYKKRIKLDNVDLAEESAQNAHNRQRERVLRDPVGARPERLVAAEAIAKRKRELNHRPSF